MLKNLTAYRLPAPYAIDKATLNALLTPQAFTPCGNSDAQSQGWVPPRTGELVHAVNKQLLLKLCTEKKLLPSSVINQVSKAKAIEIEDQQGFKPGRKQMREIKEQVTDELLPKAFSQLKHTQVWIDPVNGWLVVDSSSPSAADQVLKMLFKAIDQFPVTGLRTNMSPATAMTDWLASDEAPTGFTVDQDTELRSTGEGKATVRYLRHTLEAEDVGRHIATGKQCTRLAMTWNDRISFVLTENLTIKRITPLDVLKEVDSGAKNDDERFDGDMMLMTGELAKMLADIVTALGGEAEIPTIGDTNVVDSDFVEPASAAPHAGTGPDPLYDDAVKLVRKDNKPSISLVQRHLRIGYNRAARLLEEMETKGVVSTMQRDGTRTVLAVPA